MSVITVWVRILDGISSNLFFHKYVLGGNISVKSEEIVQFDLQKQPKNSRNVCFIELRISRLDCRHTNSGTDVLSPPFLDNV